MSVLEQYILDELESYKNKYESLRQAYNCLSIRNDDLMGIIRSIKEMMEMEYYAKADSYIIKLNVWEKHKPDQYRTLVRSLNLTEPPKNT